MATLALPNSLDDALGRNPIEFSFGFYVEDDHKTSVGEHSVQARSWVDPLLGSQGMGISCHHR